MLGRINPRRIIRDQFRPFVHGEQRRFSPSSLFLFGILPALIGVGTGLLIGPITGTTAVGLFMAVFSLMAAVLTAMISIVHSVLGSTKIKDKYAPGEFVIVRIERTRIEVLREIHTNISFSVIVLVGSLVPLLALLITLPNWLAHTLTSIVFAVAAVVALTVVSILVGIYDVLDNEAHRAAEKLENAASEVVDPTANTPPCDDTDLDEEADQVACTAVPA